MNSRKGGKGGFQRVQGVESIYRSVNRNTGEAADGVFREL